MINNCLNCGRFPFCSRCQDMHDENKECFIKRKLENYVKKEVKYGRKFKEKI